MDTFTLWHWLGFGTLVAILLALDLGVFHRHSRETTIREAGIATGVWCALALAFNGLVWWMKGLKQAGEFLAGYLVEWSLSMDNVFVFAVIFTYFRVPRKYQYRVLFWGILGAIVLRLAFISAGAALIARFHWVIYVMGVFLVYTGIKLAVHKEEFKPEKSLVIRVSRRLFRVARENHGQQFFAREAGLLCVTPLFLVLLVVEFVDVAFALDSVPAIFAITNDQFIIFTSNVFAILGLRALYFLLAGAMDLFRYLRFGLSAILVFVGVKMLVSWLKEPPPWAANVPEWARYWLGDPPTWLTLLVVVLLLAAAILASLKSAHREAEETRRKAGPSPPAALPAAAAAELGTESNTEVSAPRSLD